MSEASKERQEEVMASAYWAPQCASCRQNLDGDNCKAWGTAIPSKYFFGEQRCEKYDHRPGFEWPAVQRHGDKRP